MKRSLQLAVAVLTSVFLVACASSETGDNGTGSGGSSASGGSTGSGGSASGGSNGSGGSGSGGQTGSGGATSSGGVTGSGGQQATGGVTGSGGSASGGSVGTGGDSGGKGGSGSGGAAGARGGSSGTGGAAGGGTGGAAGSGGRGGQGGHATGGAAGGGATGTGGMGGAASFTPCGTAGGACKILPFGDSITFGLLPPNYVTSQEGGYRAEVFTRAVNAGQNVTFVGSQTSGPTTVDGKPFPQNNEGHSGWTIDPISGSPGGISTLVPSPAFDSSPQIVLLMIGTNDSLKISAQTIATDLGNLIDKVIMTAPNALLAVASIPPLSSAQSTVTAYNGMIPALVQTRAAAGKHVIFVDQGSLTASDIGSDGVHPNAGGYTKLGDNFYEAIKSYLP
ncbi:MAG TPA: SGNH/GDSL hydrolase family protein [Polyangia bacterium]|jgi:lysophospholipase L1-like esterase